MELHLLEASVCVKTTCNNNQFTNYLAPAPEPLCLCILPSDQVFIYLLTAAEQHVESYFPRD